MGRRGPGAAVVPGEKAKDFRGSSRKLIEYLKPYHLALVFIMVFAACSTVFSIVGPRILAKATDELVRGVTRMMAGEEGGIRFDYIGRILLLLMALYGVSALFSFLQSFIMANVSAKVSYRMRNALMEKVDRLPFSYFHTTSYGDVLSRITNDVDTLTQSLNSSITTLITSVATIAGVLIMMLSISWQLTLVALCIIPLSLALVLVIVKHSQKYFLGQQKYLGRVNGHVEEMYGGHVVLKAFGGEEKSIAQFDRENEQLYRMGWKSQFLSGVMMPAMTFVGNLGYVAICIAGAVLASSGAMTVGGIQAFIQYVRSFTQPITQLANISNLFQSMIAASERVFEFLGEAEETEGNVSLSTKDMEIRGDVEFLHVKFGYRPDKIVIRDFSASVKAGQKVAIVGPTGAGKTTMVKLLMRFHDLSGGQILLDGHDITEFSRRDLRDEFGMVLQDTWLYNGTIMENIRYGNLEATDEEVIAAARAAQVDHFVRTLPDGYQMVLNEEASNISQGQKQLLTIARAVLANARILILDEATSSVDTRTELLIQKAMDNLTRGRTSFIIAHRLSTIRDADLILCMKEGDIVEQGTHEELLQKGGFYANLYNSQFEQAG
ncbi:MAG: ABC transporter ATP-binding protein [Eubacteriales bacterium]|nr:ABC transporter ATP-binding protein [Eubacteriales bacterium]